MASDSIKTRDFSGELTYSASRSGGPGGQNVNKVSTKVELRFNIPESALLNDAEKERLLQKLANQINSAGELILVSQSERSQLKNKEKVTEKFYQLLDKALRVPKKRLRTAPTKASREKRLEGKKIQSQIKESRRKPLL
jgi:ribosome-associated protein